MNHEEEPREGGDLRLTCAANKHLYTLLSWRRVSDGAEELPTSRAPVAQLSSGEFSHTLNLSLSNLTADASGTYRCSALHRLTGQKTHLDERVEVTGEPSGSLLSSPFSSPSSSLLPSTMLFIVP